MTEIRLFVPSKVREAVSKVSYIPERDSNKNPTCDQCHLHRLSCFRLIPIEDTDDGVRFNVSSNPQQPNGFRRDVHVPVLSLSSETTQGDGFKPRFLFDPRWGNRIYSNTYQQLKDLSFKHTKPLRPVPSPMCNVNRKESPFTVTKYPTLVYSVLRAQLNEQCTSLTSDTSFDAQCSDLSLEDRCRLGNVLSVPVSVTAASISAHGNSKNRTLKNRMSNPSPVKLSITDQSFADPLLGASASFIQRLLEMSALQEKTVQQEKLKEFKKNRRQEA